MRVLILTNPRKPVSARTSSSCGGSTRPQYTGAGVDFVCQLACCFLNQTQMLCHLSFRFKQILETFTMRKYEVEMIVHFGRERTSF